MHTATWQLPILKNPWYFRFQDDIAFSMRPTPSNLLKSAAFPPCSAFPIFFHSTDHFLIYHIPCLLHSLFVVCCPALRGKDRYLIFVYCCCCCYVASVMSDSMRPRRRQPTRLLCPWDSPGKNTGVGCHFLLQSGKMKSLSHVQLLGTPWTAAHQAPLSMGFSRQEYWSGLPLCPKCLAHIWCSSIICWMSEFLVDKSCRINSVEYNYITSLVKNTFMTFHHLWDLVQHFRFVTGL